MTNVFLSMCIDDPSFGVIQGVCEAYIHNKPVLGGAQGISQVAKKVFPVTKG
jgi:hypothetical protein